RTGDGNDQWQTHFPAPIFVARRASMRGGVETAHTGDVPMTPDARILLNSDTSGPHQRAPLIELGPEEGAELLRSTTADHSTLCLERRTQFLLLQRLSQHFGEFINDVAGSACRRQNTKPGTCVKVLHTSFLHGGNIRELRRAVVSSDGNRLQLLA